MMGRLPHAPFEVRLAAFLFLALLGLGNAFAAWEVHNFAAFTPGAVAATVGPGEAGHDMQDEHGMEGMGGGPRTAGASGERPIDLASLDRPRHRIDRDLLVQDTHVHVPAYALTAAALALIV